ncbi:purine nucleoside phosphorylase I, inosine and guanosine-specific [Bacteriovorax sp. BAL6_X]|uniref:purine-nucleoside phosphorylase n=1 Tax=Bacteriovorax sp. BAL6_X TaxID=1201290 RepID=UPI000385E5D4|nr:purine-nucleoside phosphorylase [Bacteriovorax sp. BAL6_X]EPZ51799.1 purine nucleoside phosphorylase I, inosine and guanosine-specific [Bacteriovorax sp. BAL6_X]
MHAIFKRLEESKSYIQSKYDKAPEIGVILGSGLGEFANLLENKVEIPYEEIPGFKRTKVIGHKGQLVMGELGGKVVAVMQGRIHRYEGHSLDEVVFPVRVLKTLGIKNLIITNAAGGINLDYSSGSLVLIKDHLNLTGENCLVGENIEELGTRFPDMTYAWSPALQEIAYASAKNISYDLKEGVYVGVMGPTYETPAEIRMYRNFGGDLVGMSTVQECIAANHMGLDVLGISCVTNMAAGIENTKLNHDDIKHEAARVMKKFLELLEEVISNIK